MDIKQGNTIRFVVTFKDADNTIATSWDDIDDVIVYAYTCTNYVVKLAKVPKTGYNTLHRIDATHLLGVINADQTKLMNGELIMELCIKDTIASIEPEEIGINGAEVGICIVSSTIKAEV